MLQNLLVERFAMKYHRESVGTPGFALSIAKGIVAKHINQADRRSAFLTLAPKGHAVLEELGAVRMRVNDQTFGSLDPAKAKLLQETLDEEAATDKKLTTLAERFINPKAAHS